MRVRVCEQAYLYAYLHIHVFVYTCCPGAHGWTSLTLWPAPAETAIPGGGLCGGAPRLWGECVGAGSWLGRGSAASCSPLDRLLEAQAAPQRSVKPSE